MDYRAPDYFSSDYFTARERFCRSVLDRRGQIESILLTPKGPAGEDLTIDIGWFGSDSPHRALVHVSGLYGVDGFAGSAIQLQWLEQGLPAIPSDGAIAIVHALNPWGMAWGRRVNEDNVDLNCNFLGADEQYSELPNRNPKGLFYGGEKHVQQTRRFQLYISGRLASADRIAVLDVHAGDIVSNPDGKGSLKSLFQRMFPASELKFETQQLRTGWRWRERMLLRAENRAHFKGTKGPDLKARYCPSKTAWRQSILAKGQEKIGHATSVAFSPL